MPRQYPAGGSYRGQYNYRQQPTAQQYESFFNPVPIDFIQKQFDRRQGAYDTAFAGTMAAKEAMGQEQAALQDIGSKNQIIGDTMSNIDKIVEEKYGGDWGRASKEIAGVVTSARQNPFWETTKHLKEQQGIQQKYMLDNPNAFIRQDVLGQSSIDPETGKVRSREDITFDAFERGDYDASIEKQFADIRANIEDMGLRRVDEKGVEGMLSKERVEEITDTRLKEAAKQGVDTFLTNNPDYIEGHMTIVNPDTGEKYTAEEARAKAEQDIYGQIRDKAYKSKTEQVMQDKGYWERFAARAKAGTAADGFVIANSGDFVDMSINDPKKARKNLQNTKAQIDQLPDGPQKDQLQAQYDKDVEAREFMMETVQNSQYAVDIPSYYDEYAAWAEKNGQDVSSVEEFEERVFDAVREGNLPDRDKAFSPSFGGGYNLDNAARMAGRKMNQGMRKFVDNEGMAAINVNVIGGELGTKDQDTSVGRLNKLLTDEWNASTTGFTVPYSNRQIDDIYKNEKKYNGKGKNGPRDPDKDVVRMTDGYMAGKPVYQVTSYDKDGNKLGSEYVNPTNTENASDNIMKVAGDMVNSNDRGKQRVGKTMITNAIYSPGIQSADIRNNPEGDFAGITYEGEQVGYEKIQGEEGYRIYVTKKNGERDYFDDEDGVEYKPKDEAEIKRLLLAAHFPQTQN